MFISPLHAEVSFNSIVDVFNRYCEHTDNVRVESYTVETGMRMIVYKTETNGKEYETLDVMILLCNASTYAFINDLLYFTHNEFYATLFSFLETLNLKND